MTTYFSFCILKMLFYWLLLWMDWWEVCNDFTLCSPIHVLFHLAGFFKIFTLLLFFFFNQYYYHVLWCYFMFILFRVLWVSWICEFRVFFEFRKFGHNVFKSLFGHLLLFPFFWNSSYRNARLLSITPQFTKSCSFIFSLFSSVLLHLA